MIARIDGDGAYGRLKFESGAHRVQRVPATEAQGRIHLGPPWPSWPGADGCPRSSSTSDLRIDTFRASVAGGQHINKTDSAVRITHLPTGLVVECRRRPLAAQQDKAMQVLAARLKDKETRERQSKEKRPSASLIGSGRPLERIRTYNFPQGRVTDHRINLTLYKLQQIMEGDLEELTGALIAEHQAEQLAALGDDV